jgi:hypothetical protein
LNSSIGEKKKKVNDPIPEIGAGAIIAKSYKFTVETVPKEPIDE